MSIKSASQGVYELLTAGVSETAAAGRVYPRADVPQNPLRPYVVYFRVSGVRESKVGGGSASHARGRYQVTAYADSQLVAESIVSGIMATARSHAPGNPIRAVDIEGGPYDLPEMIDGAESLMAAVSVDVGITYREH